jgi:hypothetical protein
MLLSLCYLIDYSLKLMTCIDEIHQNAFDKSQEEKILMVGASGWLQRQTGRAMKHASPLHHASLSIKTLFVS